MVKLEDAILNYFKSINIDAKKLKYYMEKVKNDESRRHREESKAAEKSKDR